MVGTALSIPVQPDESLIAAGTRPKHSLLSRLLGGERASDHNGTHIDLDVHGFTRPLLVDLIAFIRGRIPEPWTATRWFMDSYLHGIDHKAHVCGKRGRADDPWSWALQLSFSNCAGMAEVSMRLAAHWAELWIAQRRQFIEETVLAPGGLQPTVGTILVSGAHAQFWPVGELGYAAYAPAPPADADGESFAFDVDGACFATDEDGALRALRYLEDHCRALMTDGRCRCQLCMPDFDVQRYAVPGASV